MHFSTLERYDLNDVQAINEAFLAFLSNVDGKHLRSSLPPDLQQAVTALSWRQIQRLATVPFLLVSLNETDEGCWHQHTFDKPTRDLFTPAHDTADPLCRIAMAAMSFLWQLVRRNPYAMRMISGATLTWSEQLAEQTLMNTLERAIENHHVLLPRCADNKVFWHRLLGAGVSSNAEIRRAAHLSTLQMVMLPAVMSSTQRLQAAACYSSVPAKTLNASRKARQDF
jgi:hypothetical protein